MKTEDLQIQIKTLFGLEEALAEEVKKLGGKNVEIKTRAVTCEGDLGFLYKINYSSRLAMKILVPIFEFRAFNEDKFYQRENYSPKNVLSFYNYLITPHCPTKPVRTKYPTYRLSDSMLSIVLHCN